MVSSAEQLKEVIVLGAGVIGLTTALKIQERGGYHVTVISEILPSDPKSIRYTSHWAGAHHVGSQGDDLQHKMSRETFNKMWEMSAPGSPAEECFLRINQEEYYCEERAQPDPLDVMPDFKVLLPDSLVPERAVHGTSFTTVSIDPPVYLDYLFTQLLATGGSVVRGIVQHINQVVEGGVFPFTGGQAGPRPPDAVIVCVGLGARMLGGVEDKEVFPIRGQTVLLRAPWVRFGKTLTSEDGTLTHVVPRRSGNVLVGGTQGFNDWYPCPRPETTRDILEHVLAFCPDLAPPDVRAVRQPTVEDLLPIIVEEGTGLRPARNGGIRLEVEWAKSVSRNGKVPIVHNYGHAGRGFSSSWASASIALSLLDNALAE